MRCGAVKWVVLMASQMTGRRSIVEGKSLHGDGFCAVMTASLLYFLRNLSHLNNWSGKCKRIEILSECATFLWNPIRDRTSQIDGPLMLWNPRNFLSFGESWEYGRDNGDMLRPSNRDTSPFHACCGIVPQGLQNWEEMSDKKLQDVILWCRIFCLFFLL